MTGGWPTEDDRPIEPPQETTPPAEEEAPPPWRPESDEDGQGRLF